VLFARSLRPALLVALIAGLLASTASGALAVPQVREFGPSIDAYARYEGQSRCIQTEQPGVRDFRDLVMAAYPNTGRGNIVRPCHIGGVSEHKEGRAWDWMVDARNTTQRRQADELLAWLLATDEHGNRHAMARRFGVMYIIWNGRIWHASRPDAWAPYGGANPHTDHVHFSFSWDGAERKTSYWTQAANASPAAPRSTLANLEAANLPSTCSGDAYAFAGDWNGDGRDGLGWWCDGRTRLATSSGQVVEFSFGASGDVPVVADWNGNGQDTVSVIRDGTWHINNRLSGGAAERSFTYGRVSLGDVPIAGAWNGGASDLPGIIRNTQWHLRDSQSGGSATWQFTYGRLADGDLPLWGDFNASGRDTIGIVRNGRWHLRNSLSGGPADLAFTYGRVTSGDIPVMGDWTGDGRATPAIVRSNRWHLRNTNSGGNADLTLTFPRP
jgi:hypothetical protein